MYFVGEVMRNKADTLSLFDNKFLDREEKKKGQTTERLERLDLHGELQKKILPLIQLLHQL